MVRKSWLVSLIFILSCSIGLLPQKQLTITDLIPVFKKMAPSTLKQIDIFKKHDIKYPQIGKKTYDEFFKNSAIIKGSVLVSTDFIDYLIEHLKGMARAYVAKHQMDENIKELIGDTPLDSLSEEQTIAIMELKKGKNEMTADEIKFVANMIGDVGVIIFVLSTAVDKIPDMIDQGNYMLDHIEEDMQIEGSGVLSGVMVGLAITGISDSIANLKDAAVAIPDLIKEANILYDALKMLANS